ncbi:MAG: hypothetical protein B7Y70_09650 [Rhizobiales bacterium 35-68-8]|nr:MAG: hypothetical protein B7Y70_09650 [Rhizobiales bacterium 35-68-8]
MTTTLSVLYDSREAAAAAVRDLKVIGLSDDDISVLSADNAATETYAREREDHAHEILSDAGTGAAVGAGLGGAGGLIAGLGLVTLPGLGAVLAAGWLASTAAGAAAGAAVGGAAGGLIGALTADGIDESDAHVYAEAVRRGGTLVVARVPNLRLDAARTVLDAHTGVSVPERRAAYEGEGWAGFDEQTPMHEKRPRLPGQPGRI